ncbi:DoxX family protein [Halobacterium sp. CBA1126]|uniref:DoxX family protein n=1 Tax=Halobacterium TaxID=2239 RepID=UPI0012F7D7F2|nr:DoxX family protein [Halobacterium sp. CBA1126]MUV59936.1 DoxX family membrane protein [Halobacterium sp. CBA1126]
MSYDAATPLRNDVGLELSGPWAAYWVAMLRVLTGWWFFHSGVGKLLDSGLNFGAAGYLQGMSGTTLGPLATFLAGFPDLLGALVPLGETAIGLGLMFGVLVRLASFFGALFMSLFFVGNASFGHGLVNSDLMGLLLFVTMIVFAAGRYYGLDALIERTEFVRNRPRLKYLLG